VGEKLDSLTGGTKTMINNVQKTNMIIKGILDFARTEQNDTAFSNFPLKEIIDPSVNLIMMKHRLNQFPLMTEIPEDGSIFGVKGQLQESIYNFLDNAYEAIREKLDYRLKDDAKKDFIPQILIRLCHNDTHDVIEIKDNGVGIKDGDKPKIFAAFFTTKPSSKSGSGIGSYVSKRMIEENHHGKMKFISKYMEGTTFLITLPRK
jgi:signal transduction histidine kinase